MLQKQSIFLRSRCFKMVVYVIDLIYVNNVLYETRFGWNTFRPSTHKNLCGYPSELLDEIPNFTISLTRLSTKKSAVKKREFGQVGKGNFAWRHVEPNSIQTNSKRGKTNSCVSSCLDPRHLKLQVKNCKVILLFSEILYKEIAKGSVHNCIKD